MVAHKKRHHHLSKHDREQDRENLRGGHHMNPSASRDVVDRDGRMEGEYDMHQRGSNREANARHENAFGNMSFDNNRVAGLPGGVKVEEYPHVGIFLALDDNLGGSREGIDHQMMEDQRQLEKQIRPRKI